MSNITTTYVYLVNQRLVVAKNIVEAVGIYKEYYSSSPEIESVQLVKDGQVISSADALIRK